jgi:hypothetical protein
MPGGHPAECSGNVLILRSTRVGESGRAATGCLGLGVGLGCCLAAVAAVVFSRVHHDIAPTPPDPVPFARSAPVRQADRAVGLWMEAQFRTLQRLAPWLGPVGRSVLDACSVVGSGGGLIEPGTGFGISCGRTDSRYYSFGGSTAVRVRQLKLALSHFGWGHCQVVEEFAQSGLPVVLADPVAVNTPGAKAGLRFSWAERGGQLNLRVDLGAIGPRGAPTSNYYQEVLLPGRARILSSLGTATPHLFIVSISLIYSHRGQLQVQ